MININSASQPSLEEGGSMKPSRSYTRPLPAAVAAGLLGIAAAVPAQAWDFSSGEWSGNIFTTVSYGASWRLKDTEPGDVGKQSILNDPLVFRYDKLTQRTVPGLWSANGDDGILNYPDKGDLISHTVKATVEAQVDWRNFGAFTRFSAFYDFENADKDVLSEVAKERVGKDIRLLDLYIYGAHEPGGKFLNWRLGKQVVSWGESTFIQGGIIRFFRLGILGVNAAELTDAGDAHGIQVGPRIGAVALKVPVELFFLQRHGQFIFRFGKMVHADKHVTGTGQLFDGHL